MRRIFPDKKITAVILCAGSGTRAGLGYNKVLHYIGAKTILETTLDKFDGFADTVICAASEADKSTVTGLVSGYNNVIVCTGGSTRTQSVRNALLAAPNDTDIAVIHDGARPFVTEKVIHGSIASAIELGSGVAAVRTIDSVKIAVDGVIQSAPDKNTLYNMQTPQSFGFKDIKEAYLKAEGSYGDDADVYILGGHTARLSSGDYANYKVTTAEDLLGIPCGDMRVGAGFDVHRLTAGRKLILGGVDIPHEKGLLGHSDADVVMHAVMDAVLSAAGLPDIGVLFPDTDEKYKNADSVQLFKEVVRRARQAGCEIINISAVIMAERPKLAPYLPEMRKNLAAAAGISISQINISATTTETLGIVGRGEGMASSCACLVRLKS